MDMKYSGSVLSVVINGARALSHLPGSEDTLVRICVLTSVLCVCCFVCVRVSVHVQVVHRWTQRTLTKALDTWLLNHQEQKVSCPIRALLPIPITGSILL